ncbi:MAG: GNAT family N-acetyltransferase [Candidatus Heimdallarchaeota archaeon]|nr:MAG: GNAT family N-acetyltransferase [Candidatus Heimdallarchaeota archaeon]
MPISPESLERESVKLRRLFFRKKEEKIEDDIQKGHKYIVMKMSWDQALDIKKRVTEELAQDVSLKKVLIRNFDPSIDAQNFIHCYNRAFLTAPDPYRSLSIEDVRHFKSDSTFVAILYSRIVGFIFLVIEPLMKHGVQLGNQGVIAGIGVDPRYRRKRIAFLLATRAADFFAENNVVELVCEVYHENKVSYNFIRNFGFSQTGITYL